MAAYPSRSSPILGGRLWRPHALDSLRRVPHRSSEALRAPRGRDRLGRRLMAAVTTTRDAVAGWPVRADDPGTRVDREPTLARLFARFALTGLVAVIVIGVIGFVIVRRSATSGAIRQAKSLGELAGRGIAEPLITPGCSVATPSDLARLDRVVRQRILAGTPIVRVKIWDARGRILYSDEPRS